MKSHAIVMGVLTLSLLSFTASDVQAKVKNQYCPQDEVMVGLDDKGNIVCAALKSEQSRLKKRYVFVSSSAHTGDLGGVVGADNICTNLAEAAGLYRGYKFKAWLSDDTHSPDADFVKSVVPYVDVIGDIIADDYDDLTDGSIKYPIYRTENGVTTNVYVWTNTKEDGSMFEALNDCVNWTYEYENNYHDTGTWGRTLYTNSEWTI